MKKKLFIFLSVLILSIFSFSIISFAEIPDGYTYSTNVDMNKSIYCRAFYMRKDFWQGEVLDYVSSAEFTKNSIYATVRNYFPLPIDDTIGLGVSSDMLNVFQEQYNSVNAYHTFSVATGLWCSTDVTLRIDSQPGAENLLVGDVLDNILNTVFLRVTCVLPDGRGTAFYEYVDYTPVSHTMGTNTLTLNFDYFLQINESVTNATEAKIIAYDLIFILNTDGADFAREFVSIYSTEIYTAVKPNYNLVNGQYIKDTTELSQQINALEQGLMGSIIGSLEQYTSYFSSTNVKFLEFGNEFSVFHRILSLFNNINYFQALMGLSICVGAFATLMGIVTIVGKRE